MTAGRDKLRQREGSAMVVVLGLVLMATLAASSMIVYAGSRARIVGRQLALEQAFYAAEAGAEYVSAQIANRVSVGTYVTGAIDDASYEVQVVMRPIGSNNEFNLLSTGYANGARRVVEIQGLQQVSWARYALWYAKENPSTGLWMAPGEQFHGRVYSKPRLRFHNDKISSIGKVRFYDHVWSSAKDYEVMSDAQPILERGITLNARVEDLMSVNLNELRNDATREGLVLTGDTVIEVDGRSMKVTNSRQKWNKQVVSGMDERLVYVNGNITLSAPKGIDGQLTLVAEKDINISNHVRYKTNPQTDACSSDALGLIAKNNVRVMSNAPNNLDVYAHIICVNGGFGVDGYDKGKQRGTLTVFGGVVNEIRNAVGTVGTSGYLKNYIFDKRFEKTPPPYYPRRDDLAWSYWAERAPES